MKKAFNLLQYHITSKCILLFPIMNFQSIQGIHLKSSFLKIALPITINEFEKINQNNFDYSFMTIYFAYLVCN